jgi:biopolymer transport protein ExbB
MAQALAKLPVVVKLIISLGIPLAIAIGLGIAMARAKKVGLMTLLLYLSAIVISFFIFMLMPGFVQEGGPLVGVLIFIFILMITYIIERSFTLGRAKGTKPHSAFTAEIRSYISEKNFQGALTACEKQNGSAANVLKAGLSRYLSGTADKVSKEKKLADTERAMSDATGRETPLLERNLIIMTTIASIATMVGLLGTTVGMIRAFQAMAHAGAPDAIQLAKGISEALFNTAGGLTNAILGIVAYNYYVNRVDQFTYEIDEASYEMNRSLSDIEKEK